MLHHLMIGTWTPPGAIFTVVFDDERLSLELVKRTEIPHDEPISWMTFDHARKNIYGAAMKKWSSFAVRSPSEITHESSHAMGGDPQANSPDTNTRAIFLLAATKPPYAVYCNPFYQPHAGYGNVFSVSAEGGGGGLEANIQNYQYQPDSGIHGMVFDPPTETYLYSADLSANKIWVHRRLNAHLPDPAMLELVGSLDAPDPGDHPRWVAMSPSGRFLYVLMEASNRLCEYAVDPRTHMPVYDGRSFPLVPPRMPRRDAKTGKGLFRSDVCAVSSSGRYLFASARSNRSADELTGYMAAFRLMTTPEEEETDEAQDGAIEKQLCLVPTPTSGGHSNAVSPCPWSDEWVALTDDEQGWIEMFHWDGEFFARVARLRIPEPGFGMNAIWYD